MTGYYSLINENSFMALEDDLSATTDHGSTLRQVIFLVLGVFSVASLRQSRPNRFASDGFLGRLILFSLFWVLLSVVWSQAPMLTGRRLVLLAMNCLGAIAMSRRLSIRDTIHWVFMSTLVYLELGIIAEIVLGTFHPLSEGYPFAGTIHPNNQGTNCALLFLASVFMLKMEKNWRILFVRRSQRIVSFPLSTKSRTSLVLVLFALALCWFLTLPFTHKFLIVLCMVFLTGFLLLFGELISPFFNDLVQLGRNDSDWITLTGRIPLWEQTLSYIAERPILGYGYDSFWDSRHIADFSSKQGWTVPNAHSVYIDCTLSLGIVGCSAFVMMLASGISRALAERRRTCDIGYAFLGVVLIFLVFNGLMESTIIQPSQANFLSMLALATFGFSDTHNCSRETWLDKSFRKGHRSHLRRSLIWKI